MTVQRTRPLSCDNVVALSDVTATGTTLVGKNSDRPAFESQPLVYNDGGSHATSESIELAYRTIPQADRTYATLGAAPYWCWGYEQGMNEHGVTIGNEAVFTRPLHDRLTTLADGTTGDDDSDPNPALTRGLLGMEFVRLGLERAQTAEDTVTVITKLLESYGQFGSAVASEDDTDGAYDNSYLIADPTEAWILETAGRQWAATRITQGTAAISNELTIRHQWDAGSDDLVAHAVENGWWEEDREPFDFAQAYTDHEVPAQVSRIRLQRSRELLRRAAHDGTIDREDFTRILRDHYEDTFLDGPKFNAALPDFLTVCMHSSPAKFTWGNTVSSAVFDLPDGHGIPTMWWTPIPPCVGIYVPFYVLSDGVPDVVSKAGTVGRAVASPSTVDRDEYQEGSYWWEFMQFLQFLKGDAHGSDFERNRALARKVFDELEHRFTEQAVEVERDATAHLERSDRDQAQSLLSSFTAECIADAREGIETVIEMIN
jgi:secernin